MSKISVRIRARQQNYTSLRAAFRSENGAIDLASIMVGIIVIGLIGGVIAATVFAVIPWAQDNAAKQQLDSIHSAENASYGLSADPIVTPDQSKRNMFTDSPGLETAKLLAQGPAYCVIPTAAGKDYTAYSKSGSGKIWTAMNSAKKATVLSGTPAGACSVLGVSGGSAPAPAVNGASVTTFSAASSWTFTNGIAVAADNTVYTSAANAYTIRKVAPDGTVSVVAGSGVAGFADGQGAVAKFNNKNGITLGPDGNVYVADYGNSRVRMVTPGGMVSTVLGNGATTSVDGPRATATTNGPVAVAFDPAGNMYVAELGGQKLRKVTPAGDVTTVATLPFVPRLMDVDRNGNIFYVTNASTLSKITPAGVKSDVMTTTENYRGIVIEQSTGIIYATTLNHTIEKILPNGTRSTFAGVSGQLGNVNGVGAAARFDNPGALAMDATGALIMGSYNSADTTLRLIK